MSGELGFATLRLEPPKYGWTEMWVAPPFAARALETVVSAQGSCFFLLVVFGCGSGFWEGGIFCTLFRDPSSVHDEVV